MTAATKSKLPVYTRHIDLPLHLAPAYLAQPMQGVREQLDRSSMRYVDQLGGVLLSYKGLQLKRALGRIAYDAPDIHVRASFDATFFAPKPGDVIQGVVSRLGHDHIALLVMEVFNGSVGLPAGWDPANPSVQVDAPCSFVVREVRHTNGLISMHGELGDGGAAATARGQGATPRSGAAAPKAAARSSGGSTSGAARADAPAAATPAAASSATPAAPAVPAGDGITPAAGEATKRKRTPEEKEAKRKRKAEKAAKAAAAQ